MRVVSSHSKDKKYGKLGHKPFVSIPLGIKIKCLTDIGEWVLIETVAFTAYFVWLNVINEMQGLYVKALYCTPEYNNYISLMI